jgi:membrane associated rhomboid family serine protease
MASSWHHNQFGEVEMSKNLRALIWASTMAYFGFLFSGRGYPSINSLTASGTLMGAVGGLLLAMMFLRRADRKKV